MNRTLLATMLMGTALLAGCVTVSEKYEINRREEARTYAAKGDYQAAYIAIKSDLAGRGPSADKAAEVINENARFKNIMPKIILAEMESVSDPDRLQSIVKSLDYDGFSKSLSVEDLSFLRKSAEKIAADGNANNKLQWILTDDLDRFKLLEAPEHQKIIFARSLALMGRRQSQILRPRSHDLTKKVFARIEGAGIGSDEYNIVKLALQNLDISTQDLRGIVRKFFPQFAEKELAAREIAIKISSDDRLIEEDVISKLKTLSPDITSVRDGDASILVKIRKLQWDERILPQQNRTVTYSQSDVTPLSAYLMMPDNSSYQYDYSSGGVQLLYAFEMKATINGAVALNELVRDRTSREWRTCFNARILNAFGGVQRADFVANYHMQSVCNSGGSPISPDELRGEAIEKIVASIIQIPAIARAIPNQTTQGTIVSSISKIEPSAFSSIASFVTGDRVRHASFGAGTVRGVTSTEATVLFDGHDRPVAVALETLAK